ncbi:MAG: hypothetical protein ACYDB7_12470 [Mycobacteriales bacterium]
MDLPVSPAPDQGPGLPAGSADAEGSESGPPEAEPAPDPEPPPDDARAGRAAVRVALAGVLVAALVTLILLGLAWHGEVSTADAAARLDAVVASAARQQTVNFTAFDYRSFTAIEKTWEDNSVGVFHDELPTLISLAQLQLVPDQSVGVVNVLSVAVVAATQQDATVLVSADEVVHNKLGQSTDRLRLKLDLARQGNQWLLAGITYVPLVVPVTPASAGPTPNPTPASPSPSGTP